MEYSSFTKKMLSSYFKNNNNLVILNGKSKDIDSHMIQDNLINFILTMGIYYWKSEGKKSVLVTKDRENIYNSPFIKNYFDIISEYENNDTEKNSRFVLFIADRLNSSLKDILKDGFGGKGKRFCIILNSSVNDEADLDNKASFYIFKNIDVLENNITVPENIIFLNSLTKKEKKNTKKVYVGYLPLEEKIKLKNISENNEKIYSDNMVFEIL